jgi:hypothetical protein
MQLVDVPDELMRPDLVRRLPRRVSAKLDLACRTFKKCEVIGFAGYIEPFSAWLCRCKCGNLFLARTNHIKYFGCGRCNNRMMTGLSQSQLGRTWRAMMSRCYRPRDTSWQHYGGRGITVCERWRESLLAFIEDMGPKPAPNYSIDRIDNDGNYEPGNCRWATQTEQVKNQRRSRRCPVLRGPIPKNDQCGGWARLIECGGESRSIKSWAEFIGVSQQAIRLRLELCNKYDIPEREAVSTPAGQRMPSLPYVKRGRKKKL